MGKIRLGSPQSYILLFNWIGPPLIVIYILSMFVVPLIKNGGDWQIIQSIWDRWQSLNVGMLAFLSSLIAFNISNYNAERQRSREFLAAKSFLPEAFSELTKYCRESMVLFMEAWRRASDDADRCDTALKAATPLLPEGYREIFRECIKAAEPKVGDRLSYILMLLQIHHSRMTGLAEEFTDNEKLIIPRNIVNYVYGIAKIQALINKTYEYARGTGPFDDGLLVWEDFQSVLWLADVEINEIDGLQECIEQAISREVNT